ncbi:hypothetical protein EC396_06530 [Lutibacter sp. HS1-25]|uniref:Stealth CR1 domain-containing protein n=1 Tax=Lutibacter sp. HS1-25 TaxID=2485000 RepID=UPI0010100FCB|nr:Stealth CR1 domain-containing protein [Lutibacter sp. HS1-25]RXP57607.1 hypothetical protein EC396_06530 [Lutibacter sp. HS1-25]
MVENINITKPIDAVISWVDGEDENHIKKMAPYISDEEGTCKNFRTRFDQVEEIKFTVDSILKNASFIRNIFIVTDNQTPSFLNNDSTKHLYKKVIIVDHSTIFKGYEAFLPTFNCRPIETQLYKIPDLAEHFVYFNDDMFLVNKTNPTDFFIDEFPVLRGKWLKFDDDLFYKKIKKIFLKKKEVKKAGHKIAQQLGASIVGFKKYYKFHHTPYPLRKSTFENFFSAHKNIELENLKYRFRSANQFTPQGLANHIEIKNKTCVLKSDYQMVYIQSYKKPLSWYMQVLKSTTNKNKLFLCLQSLDQCPKDKLKHILYWLNEKFQH